MAAAVAVHADDAAVAAAHAAAHDLLEGHEDGPSGGCTEVGHGAHHRRRTARVDRDAVPAGVSSSARASGAVMRPRSPRVPSSVVRMQRGAERAKEVRVVQIRGRPRAVEQAHARAARAPAPRRASQTARGPRRRPPSTPSAGGSTGTNGRPSGPSTITVSPGSAA